MRDQRLWSVQECADIFATSLNSLKADLEKQGDNGILVWDKVRLSGNFMYFFVKIQRQFHQFRYCKFGNFRVTFISRIFYFPIISETLNSRSSTRAVYKAYSNSLLARTLFSRGNEFANISEN